MLYLTLNHLNNCKNNPNSDENKASGSNEEEDRLTAGEDTSNQQQIEKQEEELVIEPVLENTEETIDVDETTDNVVHCLSPVAENGMIPYFFRIEVGALLYFINSR